MFYSTLHQFKFYLCRVQSNQETAVSHWLAGMLPANHSAEENRKMSQTELGDMSYRAPCT